MTRPISYSLRRRRLVCCLAALTLGACVPKGESQSPKAAGGPVPSPAASKGEAAPAMPGVNVSSIKVNTVGYPVNWPKIAVFNRDPTSAKIVDESGATVFSFSQETIVETGVDKASGDPVWRGDFSELTAVGTYKITLGDESSELFEITEKPYQEALRAAQKMFYFQRTRTALEAPYAVHDGDSFLRPGVSHAHENVGWDMESYPEKKKKWELEAGWHDAGNFDMYVPSTGPSAQGLLMAYQQHPELFSDGELNIPESKNGVPDILDEAKWGIRWVLSMQEPGGAFRNRETTITQSEAPEGPAHLDMSTRWVDRVGSASTAKGCALAALAARVYAPHDPEFAEKNRERAQLAWKWLQAHPERVMVPPVGAAVNNEYLIWDDGKEVASDRGARFIAAAEMWLTFREESALSSLTELMKSPEAKPYAFLYGGWTNLTRWGLEAISLDEKTPEPLRNEAKKRLIEAAGIIATPAKTDGYLCATKPGDYYWGSNSNLMEKAQLLMVAARLDQEVAKWAIPVARDQWHWILGRNPNGYSMVTRVGREPTAMYHLEWGRNSPKLPPGFLLGGPNHHNMKFLAPDAPAKALLWEAPHVLQSGAKKGELWHWQQSDLWEAGFVADNEWTDGWWAVTEPDIYYNMNLVLMAAEMQKDALESLPSAESLPSTQPHAANNVPEESSSASP